MIDSDVLIDVSRGNQAAINYIDLLSEPWTISQVTALELIFGARDKREVAALDEFISQYAVLPLNSEIGATAYRLLRTYAKSHGLGVFDSLIAATAVENAFTLVTRNRKHYSMIEGLLFEIPSY